jgi:hypothetical protein
MLTLILAPIAYLAVPVGLSLDVVPQGLKEAVGPKLRNPKARGFLKQVITELEGAVERAGDTYAEKKPAEAADREQPQEPGQ